MKIVIAIDSFKGSVSSEVAGTAFAEGVLRVNKGADIKIVQLSDGGEGMLDALSSALNVKRIKVSATDPVGRQIEAEAGSFNDTMIIESAQVCGLSLIPEDKRNPMYTDSGGLGALIKYGISKGYKTIIIGLGGSGVNDAGIGMLREMGYRFYDKNGIMVGRGGKDAIKIETIDTSEAMAVPSDCRIIIASDVDNPLYGERGASKIYGPQKGADDEMVMKLDEGLRHYSDVVGNHLGYDYSRCAGSGAAGGIGFSILSFLRGIFQSGIETVLEIINFDEIIDNADLVVTGEGYLDYQTLMGKAPYGVMLHAVKKGIPVIGIGGGLDNDAVNELMRSGFTSIFPIVSSPMSLRDAMNPFQTIENIKRTSEMILRLLQL
ncbi:MAG: glycerate kinase [Muribaculaceae bacterium]|nr:glycerate kinase [Muribaculaceae bacterium]